MVIRRLNQNDEIVPMSLLLLADPSEEMIRGYLNKGECFVAEVENKIVGVCVLSPISSESTEIVNVAVSENYQGKGIGKQLVLHAIQTARFLGFKTIEIGTGNSSIGQLALYQKCGFQIECIDKDYFIKNYPEEIYENGIQCRDMIRLKQEL
ncbi:MAG: family N-acetyltransferase [Bacillales bacterium]|jgi:ribosomal protein S18 acetylase RimI-like enzyme|nr:family N-acetyltransferase [Bacillales bacterium]